ncbi:MAG: hypothetical protein PVG83_14480 [Acidimicrobiia bacterium]|jgi:hypothetical protein
MAPRFLDPAFMKLESRRRHVLTIWIVIALLALATTGCGSADTALDNSSDTQPSASTTQSVDPDAPSGTDAQVNAPDTTLSSSPLDAVDLLDELWESEEEAPPLPSEGPSAYVGGSPHTLAAIGIARGLEEAGVDLSGISLSVLPINGTGASLLVMETTDEYLDSALATEEEGSNATVDLLALPEIENASIEELVTIYRGVDEEGPYTLTFAVSVEDLRHAQETGSELDDEQLLVQVDRGP